VKCMVKVTVEPSTLMGKVGDRVGAKVCVYGVSNLWAFDMTLSWDPKVLKLVSHDFGTFLRPSDPTKVEVLTKEWNGNSELGARLISPESPKSGDGVLTMIVWEVLSTSYTKINITSKLIDPDANLIAHDAFGAEFGQKFDVQAVINTIVPIFAVVFIVPVLKTMIKAIKPA